MPDLDFDNIPCAFRVDVTFDPQCASGAGVNCVGFLAGSQDPVERESLWVECLGPPSCITFPGAWTLRRLAVP